MIGKTLSHYQVSEKLGAGGMGAVYRAKDQKLGRDVAIKVLPEEFAKDTDRVARFQREAKLLASLNHPNIAAIYGLEEAEGASFLVLELVEGETLADQLKKGPIPVEKSLRLALQIAEALEAAHEKGVIHRDLKPANIKVTPDGKVKVLDFGLAKAFAGEQSDLNLSNSPTLSNAATQQGVILGTAGYMSPEQARGESVDKKADIWAFGCVLFEMLTGRGTFEGRTLSDVLASVIKSEPEWNRLPPNLHPRIRLLLERCLEKEAKNRCHDVADVRVDIQKALADPGGMPVQPAGATATRKKLRLILPWVAAAAVLTAIIAGAVVWKLRTPEPRQVVRFYHELPKDQQFTNQTGMPIGISRDGKQLVYSTTGGLYLRSANDFDAKLIAGTETDPSNPIFSPDGQWVGYFSGQDNKLKKIAIGGGAPVSLCDAATVVGAGWSADGSIVYAEWGKGIKRVSADGGNPELIVKEEAVYHPQLLPDGKSLFFTLGPAPYKTVVQSLKSGERKELFTGDDARYIPTGHIFYAVGNNLFAVPFDLGTTRVTGGPIPAAEGVHRSGAPLYVVSDSGTLVYVSETENLFGLTQRTLVWVDRKGNEEPLPAPPNVYFNPRISRDGTRVALGIEAAGKRDIWVWNLVHKTLERLTFEGNDYAAPLWTPDGKRIAFNLVEKGIYWKAADGGGKEELLVSGSSILSCPFSWASNGKEMIVMNWSNGYDIAMLPMEGDRKYRSLLNRNYNEAQPHISPDGRWMAYTSNESGQNQIYVRPFPEVESGRWQISTSGADSPLWSPDGRELFYRSGDAIIAAELKTEPAFSLGTSNTLFRGAYVRSVLAMGNFDFATWHIHPDGKRFLMMKETGSGELGGAGLWRINVVLNWSEELKQRIP